MAETEQKEKGQRPYYWWHGRDLCGFFNEVARLGAENVRVELHPEDGLLHVVPAAAEEGAARAPGPTRTTFNFVHTCPPECH